MNEYIVELVKTKQFKVKAKSLDEAENMAILLDSSKEEDIAWVNKHYDEIMVEQI